MKNTPPKRVSNQCFIALGANLLSVCGSPKESIVTAISAISDQGFIEIRQSHFYRTPAFPKGNGPDYVNAVISAQFQGESVDVMRALHSVEEMMGRTRQERWESRVIDLDLLAIDQHIVPDRDTFNTWMTLPLSEQKTRQPQELIVPHPRIQDRGFVLVPLADVAPDWRHPILNKTVLEMLDALEVSEIAEIVQIAEV